MQLQIYLRRYCQESALFKIIIYNKILVYYGIKAIISKFSLSLEKFRFVVDKELYQILHVSIHHIQVIRISIK